MTSPNSERPAVDSELAPTPPTDSMARHSVTVEGEAIRARYERRGRRQADDLYSPLHLDVLSTIHQRERALRSWYVGADLGDPGQVSLLEVGCGTGGWLQSFLRLGFDPANLSGIDLLPESIETARHRLPDSVRLSVMDAAALQIESRQYDVCTQATAFSSILDDGVRQRVASTMWRLTRPGGGVLTFDFAYDNPRNPDVRGLSVAALKALFPESARPRVWRLVLAPPIGRRAARLGQLPYSLLQALPPLRTHRLIWFPKPTV